MIEALTETEKEVMFLLIQGQNFNGISSWMHIDYSDYIKIKKSIFRKIKVKRSAQLLYALIKNGVIFEDL